MSEFIREQIVRGLVVSLANTQIISRMSDEINAIGVNINQIAKVVNTTQNIHNRDTEKLRDEVDKIYRVVMNYLYNGKA